MKLSRAIAYKGVTTSIQNHITGAHMYRFLILFTLVAMIAITGCASTGNDSVANETQQTVASKIVEGKTTKDEVRQMYGEPNTVSSGTGGAETWIYSFAQAKQDPKAYIPLVGIFMAKNTSKANTLLVAFDKKGVVKNYQFNAQNSTSSAY